MKRVALVLALLIMATACQTQSDSESDQAVAPTSSTTTTVADSTTTSTTTTTTTVPPTTTTTIATPEPIPVAEIEGWELVWADEFDGEEINPDNWGYDIGGWGWGNGEAQYYTDRTENAWVQNGLLVIKADQERYENSYYTSARLVTQDLQEFQYGRIEARIKVPEGIGLWPAFWMLGADFDRNPDDPFDSNWPHVGEIDIMEYVGREPDLIMGTVHGPGYAGATALGKWNRQDYPIADEFHTYAIEWDVDGIRWFYDGELYSDMSRDIVGPNRDWVFDNEFFILLNLAVGGNFAGPLALDLEFPVHMHVDYVRVYQEIDDE